MTATPELEAPERQGSRFRGILGAFLGAVLWSCLSGLLIFLFVDELAQLIMLGNMLLAGWIASWGYRLMRGCRSMKFAQWTVRISIVLAQPLVAVTRLISFELWPFFQSGTPISWEVAEEIGLRTAEALQERGAVAAIGGMVFLGLIFSRLGWGVLLKYIDPNWYDDPRRLAQLGGGGATFNMVGWPLPQAESIPEQFEVDKGKLKVVGDTITYKGWNKPPQSFLVSEVTGVIFGVPTGYNILYDKENRMLAKFAWSRKNAVLFGQYLIAHQIPFRATNGEEIPVEPFQVEVPARFVVREPKWHLRFGCFLILLSCGVAAFFRLSLGSDPLVYLLMGFFLVLGILGGLSGLLEYKNYRVEVDGNDLYYRSAFGKETRFHLDEVEEAKYVGVGLWELRDKNGKRLARFEEPMENFNLLAAYMNRYLESKKKNRKD